jgi:chemotaxis protein CheZ
MENANAVPAIHDDSIEEALHHAEELVKELQKGNDEKASTILQHINLVRESSLYQEVGKMTRQLHDSLRSFSEDSRIDHLAEQEIPDARERLAYVIAMTEQAADKTLSAVENTLPVAEKISERADLLSKTWKKFRARKLSADEFRTLAEDIELFLDDIDEQSNVMKNNLTDVLMAQEYQDLSGQIIKRVITLVEEVEGNLVQLIRLTGQKYTNSSSEEVPSDELAGPQVPGVGSDDAITNQDDVDDLLSSLGF